MATAGAAAKPRERSTGLFLPSIVTRRVALPVTALGRNTTALLLGKFSSDHEGRCISEGYVRPGSIRLASNSAGELAGSNIMFEAAFECSVCRPVEGMNIGGCIVRNVTKAGVRATIPEPSPVVVFIARDHEAGNEAFAGLAPGDIVTARVVGSRYEIGDQQIAVVATLARVERRVPRD
jgi:hypothetical protein